jgi:hypothetical protein
VTKRDTDHVNSSVVSHKVQADDGSWIPSTYRDFLDIFRKKKAETLPPHRTTDHAIDLELGTKLPYGRIYSLSEVELKALKAYIETNLASGFIQRSSSPAASPILLVKKKDGSLKLCVDYRALNHASVKNRYPLPLISEILERVGKAKIFTKLDLRGAYNLIRIKEGDEFKTAFRTRYGQFEYRVMPFGLTNAPATFQVYMDDCLRPYMDDFVVCYLDDILIYSEDPVQHEGHVTKVLERLREYGLYCKAEKCEFSVKKVGFLGFVISPDGIEMEADRIATIEDWPTPKSVKDVQVLMGFTNFYRRFVRKYAKVTAPNTNLLKKSEKWEWTREADAALQKLKRAFTEATILQHFDADKPITLQTDASGFAIARILNQFDCFGVLRPTSFYSRKCSPAEQNYDTYDRELLAIVASMKQWRHHLEGARYKILIQCDHKNLEYFQTTKVLARRQARWAEILPAYDFTIEHLDGTKNPADGPSQRPDYEEGYERPSARLLATTTSYQYLFANAVEIEPIKKDLQAEIIESQKTDGLATELLRKLDKRGRDHLTKQVTKQHVTEEETTTEDWAVSAGALTYEGRVYVPEGLRSKVTALHHDNPESGHFGALKTAELVSRNFYWPALQTSVRQYVAGCEVCQRIKAARHAKYGVIIPIEPPSQPWEGVTMDFVTDLPESTASAYTGILVIVDRLTKMAIYLPCRKDVDSPELARMFFEEVICKHGVPSNIVTDRGSQFTSRFWNRVCSHLSIDHRLSTSFHPQTDRQTERQNQTMEQYLRAFATYEQDNWVELLPLAEFAYNNAVHATTRLTPFFANYGYHPDMHFKPPKDARFRSERAADERLGKLQAARNRLRESILEAQERQTRYAGGKEMTFEVGDKVWLSAKHIQTARPSKKLDYKRLGPFKVTKVINRNAYRLELPYSMKVHNVFHVS